MSNSIQLLKEFSVGKVFEFEAKKYVVQEAGVKNFRFCVFTDRRNFVFLESEFGAFYDKVKWYDDFESSSNALETVVDKSVSKVEVLSFPVLDDVQRSVRVSEKLEDMFNALANETEVSDANLKKAKAMVDLSNSIVANAVMRVRLMSLNK
jgi:hypothetical protein